MIMVMTVSPVVVMSASFSGQKVSHMKMRPQIVPGRLIAAVRMPKRSNRLRQQQARHQK
jgi:hypothetical protein